MAKGVYVNYKKAEQELFRRTEGYAAKVGAIYRAALSEIIDLVKGTKLSPGKPFSFEAYGFSDEVTPILRNMYSRVYQTIRGGVEKEWLMANENNDGLVKAVFGEHSIEDSHFARFFQRNMEAMAAFFARKTSDGGLNLSQKVWKYTGIYKDELEDALDLAIGEGTAANRLASQIQKYLNEPDRFYRRFRVKTGEDEDGKPIYGRIWKRRIYDPDSDSYQWIDDDPRKYHPGRGVYRSSYRNAQRLARTETNIAYRSADFERWQQLDFVIGVEIRLSNNHPTADICDQLNGKYPKDFKWTGWHPNCRCHQVPLLASREEMEEMIDAILDGENTALIPVEGKITDTPKQFKDWIKNNEERIERARENGTTPYFIRDNISMVDKVIEDERALQSKIAERRRLYEELRSNPDYQDVRFNPDNGGLMATHIGHNFDKRKGWYEKSVQEVGFNAGHSVIFGDERQHKGEEATKVCEGLWDGMKFEIGGAETGTANNIKKALNHCASKPDVEIAVVFIPDDNLLDIENIKRGKSLYYGLVYKGMPGTVHFKKVFIITPKRIL